RTIRDRPLRDPNNCILRQHVVEDRLSVRIVRRRDVVRRHVLLGRFDTGRSSVALIGNMIRMCVVDRYADLILTARRASMSRLRVEWEDYRRMLLLLVRVCAERLGIAHTFTKSVLGLGGVDFLDADADFFPLMYCVQRIRTAFRELPFLLKHMFE